MGKLIKPCHCERCGHDWLPRKTEKPVQCSVEPEAAIMISPEDIDRFKRKLDDIDHINDLRRSKAERLGLIKPLTDEAIKRITLRREEDKKKALRVAFPGVFQ
jgi:hypothetical protein